MAQDRRRDWRFWLTLSLVAIVALSARLIGIDRTTLWADEVRTASSLSLSVAALIEERLEQAHSPAFYLLLKGLSIPSDSLFLLRLPAAFFGVATVVAGVFAGRALAGPLVGWMAGVLLAITPVLVDYGQEARPYSALTLGVVLALWGAAFVVRLPQLANAAVNHRRWFESRRMAVGVLRSAWLLLISGSLLAAFMLPLGLFLWFALDLAVAGLIILPRSRWRPLVRPWIAHRLVCVVIYLPLALALTSAIHARVGAYWAAAPSWPSIWMTIGEAFLFQFRGDPGNFAGDWARTSLVILLLTAAVFGTLNLRKQKGAFAIVIAAFFVPIIVIGLITTHTPIWISRYLLIANPAFTLILAIGLATAWRRRVGQLITTGIVILAVLQIIDLQNSWRRADWRPLVDALSRATNKVVLVTSHGHHHTEIEFEWRRQGLPDKPSFAEISELQEPRPDTTYWLIQRNSKQRSIAKAIWPDRRPRSFGSGRGGALIYPPKSLMCKRQNCAFLGRRDLRQRANGR